MPRANYRGSEYETVRYNPVTERWYLRPANGPDTVVYDPEFHEVEVECERCGTFKAYIYPVTTQALWLCSDCEEAVTHGE
jgi:hypothetical protein